MADFPESYDAYRHTVANILETLANLIYLTRLECDDRDKVILYMDLSDERLAALVHLIKGP